MLMNTWLRSVRSTSKYNSSISSHFGRFLAGARRAIVQPPKKPTRAFRERAKKVVELSAAKLSLNQTCHEKLRARFQTTVFLLSRSCTMTGITQFLSKNHEAFCLLKPTQSKVGFMYAFWYSLLSTSSILEQGFQTNHHLQMTSSEGFQQHFSIVSKFVCCCFYMKKNVDFTLISFAVLK